MAFGTTSSATKKLARYIAEWDEHATTLNLTTSQARFARRFFMGANLCLTGEAGTGKSYLTKAISSFLIKRSVSVGMTGTTGVAAFNIGGQTIHSFAGLGLADEPAINLIAKVYKNRKAKERICGIDVLFIDEASMAKGDLLNKVNEVFKAIRRSVAPFGGVQVVFIADFLQLPPIFKADETQELAFQCAAWREAQVETVVLVEQMRQKTDQTLLKVLNNIRVGETSSLHLLESRVGAAFPNDGIEPVRIFCRNVDVDRYNAEKLALLTTPAKTYKARDNGQPYHTDAFNKNCPAPETLELKIGAQVMLTANLDVEDRGLVNGAIGVVEAFGPDGVTVRFVGGTEIVPRKQWDIKEQEIGSDGKLHFRVVATRQQMPLRLAWACTVHRVQGQTLDRVIIDVSDAFADHMIYVALSRVRDISSLSIDSPIPHHAVRVNPECIAFYRAVDSVD